VAEETSSCQKALGTRLGQQIHRRGILGSRYPNCSDIESLKTLTLGIWIWISAIIIRILRYLGIQTEMGVSVFDLVRIKYFRIVEWITAEGVSVSEQFGYKWWIRTKSLVFRTFPECCENWFYLILIRCIDTFGQVTY